MHEWWLSLDQESKLRVLTSFLNFFKSKTNFDLKKVKTYVHGFGIYFSEQPEVSIGYARGSNSLLLCQVLLGKPGVDSKEVKKGTNDGSWAVIIGGDEDEGRMDQILPTYVVNFK